MNDTNTIDISRVSFRHSEASPIIVRDGERTRLVFLPEINTLATEQHPIISGCFVYQKKENEKWIDEKHISLSKVQKNEFYKLDLSSDEFRKLMAGITQLTDVTAQFGMVSGKYKIIKNPDEALNQLIDWLQKNKEKTDLLAQLKDEDIFKLRKLNGLVDISKLKYILTKWEENKSNSSESFWQDFFSENTWIISQLFSSPIVLISEKAYVGGKRLDSIGGNFADFIVGNKLTNNISIIEIKTPGTPLLGSMYRHPEIYSISNDISGGLTQVLEQKQKLLVNWLSLKDVDYEKYQAINPRCFLIIGQFSDLDTPEKVRSFQTFRHGVNQVEIVTYDELFDKAKSLFNLLDTK